MIEKKVLVKNLETNYKVFGEGEPFLILHGWGSNSDKWQKVSELLQGRFQVIVPDLPGFGKSEAPKNAWSIDNYVEWLLEFAEKVLELNKSFHLLGHSFGGTLSAKFTIKYNQKVEKLFLISAACVRRNTTIKKFIYRIAKIVKIFSFFPYYQQFRKAVYKFIIRKSDYPYASDVMQEVYLKVISDDLSYKLFFIKVPTIIVFGDKDTITPIAQANLIKEKISGSKLVIISGADHFLNVKVPEILAQKILETIP